MNPGKITCEVLKKIRSEIADVNQIEYNTYPCSFKGECISTCPKCEAELHELEHQLIKKNGFQKTAIFAGVSLSLISESTSCNGTSNKLIKKTSIHETISTALVKTIDSTSNSNQNNSVQQRNSHKDKKQIIELLNVDSSMLI
jgi:periplasmic protein TonB